MKVVKIFGINQGIFLSFEKFAYGVEVTSLPNLFDFDEVHKRLKFITWLFNSEFDAIFVMEKIVLID